MSRKRPRRHKKYMPVWQPSSQTSAKTDAAHQAQPTPDNLTQTKDQTKGPALPSHRGARTSLAGRHK